MFSRTLLKLCSSLATLIVLPLSSLLDVTIRIGTVVSSNVNSTLNSLAELTLTVSFICSDSSKAIVYSPNSLIKNWTVSLSLFFFVWISSLEQTIVSPINSGANVTVTYGTPEAVESVQVLVSPSSDIETVCLETNSLPFTLTSQLPLYKTPSETVVDSAFCSTVWVPSVAWIVSPINNSGIVTLIVAWNSVNCTSSLKGSPTTAVRVLLFKVFVNLYSPGNFTFIIAKPSCMVSV